MITNIGLKDDTIVVKMFKPGNSVLYSYKPVVDGWHIKIDSSATGNEYDRIYQPEFYKPPTNK